MWSNTFAKKIVATDYVDYQKINKTYNFNEINTGNIEAITREISQYRENYPKSRYAYILAKEFFLGIGLSIDNNKIDIKNLILCGKTLDNFAKDLITTTFFQKDTVEEKQRLEEAYMKIFMKIVETSQCQAGKPLGSSLISKICELSIVDPLENDSMKEVNSSISLAH
jgi:hypothetical protein